MYKKIKNWISNAISLINCITTGSCTPEHIWISIERFNYMYNNRKIIPIRIDVRENLSLKNDWEGTPIPYNQISDWIDILEALEDQNKQNQQWLLFVYSDRNSDLQTVESILKKRCKPKNVKLKCPNAVFYAYSNEG